MTRAMAVVAATAILAGGRSKSKTFSMRHARSPVQAAAFVLNAIWERRVSQNPALQQGALSHATRPDHSIL